MWFAAKEEEVQKLREEGLAALESGDARTAVLRGEALVEMRWSGGFELVALGKRALGDLPGALRALETAAEVAPAVWSLAQLRGNVLDEMGKHEEAVDAFSAALKMPEAWRGAILYNRAVANASLDRWGDALADAEGALEDARDAAFTLPAIELAVEALGKLGRHEHAIALLETVGSASPEAEHALMDLRVAALVAAKADAALIDEAVARAIEAGAAGMAVAKRTNRGGESSDRKVARVLLRGPAPTGAPAEVIGTFRPATVRAKDEAEALALLKVLEPLATRDALALEVYEPFADEDGPAEVLHLAGRILYGAE